jgi:hypothetical protein
MQHREISRERFQETEQANVVRARASSAAQTGCGRSSWAQERWLEKRCLVGSYCIAQRRRTQARELSDSRRAGYREVRRCAKGGSIAGVIPERSTDRSPPTQRSACYALVGLLTSEIDPAGLLVAIPVIPKSCATMARRLEDRCSNPIKHSVTAAGAVPESHRVPCTSALPQERPTTNAQFKRPNSIAGRAACQRV